MESKVLLESSIPHISYNAWKSANGQTTIDNSSAHLIDYISLLKENHNLVLAGAPGTGKTYMARKIAEEMEAVTAFVQFHPSYDYSDFVEGLRPVEIGSLGQIGFERKDGVFKAFCAEAERNLLESKKDPDQLKREDEISLKITTFLGNSIGKTYKTKSGQEYELDFDDDYIYFNIHNSTISYNKCKERISFIRELLLKEQLPQNPSQVRENTTQQKDSYIFPILEDINNTSVKSNSNNSKPVSRKNFVFIIDEINRGEVSKIFGELFYAIDPGYRGEKENRVQTQYQNLVQEKDSFKEGFYVPENVYIVATMNDIDRSVESMDFAFRRRFTWKEVTPQENEYILDSIGEEKIVKDAKIRMKSLNETISKVEGLGAAYMIGPAYFLKLRNYGGSVNKLWELNIEPLLKEYLRGFRDANETMETLKKSYFLTDESDDKGSVDNGD